MKLLPHTPLPGILFVLIGFLLCPPHSYALLQESGKSGHPAPSVKENRVQFIKATAEHVHEIAVWGGYSFNSSNKIWGKTPDAQLGMLGLRYNRKFFKTPGSILEYVTELNFFANYNFPEFREADLNFENRKNSFGFGLSPLGFQFNLNAKRYIQPFLKSSAGFIYLTNPFPDNRGVRFNFTLEVGTGFEVIINRYSSFTLGYKYHHMSNGEIGQINPGIDSNIFYAGITLF